MKRESSPAADARAWVEVDLGALVRNARALSAHAAKPLIPMVKADAYGLGAVPVVRALESVGPLAYGVSSLVEGEELRRAGITRPIIHFTPSPLESSDGEEMVEHRITPTFARSADILAWGELRSDLGWHLAIDTGMHRAGADHAAVGALRDALLAHPPEGAFTHFHSSESDDGSIAEQERLFRDALAALPARPRLLHTENSSAIARRSPSPWDCVRPGIFLYGVGGGRTAILQPEPVVTMRARILELRDVKAGESVSYGATWRALRRTRIATVACGYADGLRRQIGNGGVGLVRGQRAPIVGVVTMDMTMLDVSAVPCEVGDVITFLGRDGGEQLTVEAVAVAAGLSPYELLTGLKMRLPRTYLGIW